MMDFWILDVVSDPGAGLSQDVEDDGDVSQMEIDVPTDEVCGSDNAGNVRTNLSPHLVS